MSKANAVLAAVVVILVAGCFVIVRQLGFERNRVQMLEAQIVELQREVNTRQESCAAQESAPICESTPSSGGASAAPATPATPAAPNKPVAAQRSDRLTQWREMLADPAYRDAMRVQHRMRLEPQRTEIAAELGLSKDQTERFLDLLAEHSVRESEYRMKDELDGTDLNSEEGRRRSKERNAQFESERKAFLGEERFLKWTKYVNSAGARAHVRELRTELATSNSPLRDDQAKPLIAALAAEQQRHAAERRDHHSGAQWTEETPAAEQIAYMTRRAELIEESLERAREVGAMYLDFEQQRRFDEMLARRRERARAELELWRASLEAEKRLRTASGSR